MLNLKNQRQLFTDDIIIDKNNSTAKKRLNAPIKGDITFIFDAPWEKSGTVYHNIVKNPNGTYFMYYKGYHPDENGRNMRHICLLTSDDGLNWERPKLNINPIFKDSNIISQSTSYDNFFCFYDTNPTCPDSERYKALIGEWNNGLYVALSPDGINFKFHRYTTECDVSERKDRGLLMLKSETNCHFDTLNTVFYKDGLYHAYVRGIHRGNDYQPEILSDDDHSIIRDIRHTTSADFYNWSEPQPLKYNDNFDYELYTNGIFQYYRAPDFLLGIATRYVVRENWNSSFDRLPNAKDRKTRSRGMSLTDAVFMASHNGTDFIRYNEMFITPGSEQTDNWRYGDCYVCVGAVETPSEIENQDPCLSLFCPETVNGKSVLFRHTLRLDGFVSYSAPLETKILKTKPFIFDGEKLLLNFRTSALGKIKITLKSGDTEIQSDEIFGDKVDRIIDFNGDLSAFKNKEVTMLFEISDGEIYSFKFE